MRPIKDAREDGAKDDGKVEHEALMTAGRAWFMACGSSVTATKESRTDSERQYLGWSKQKYSCRRRQMDHHLGDELRSSAVLGPCRGVMVCLPVMPKSTTCTFLCFLLVTLTLFLSQSSCRMKHYPSTECASPKPWNRFPLMRCTPRLPNYATTWTISDILTSKWFLSPTKATKVCQHVFAFKHSI